MKILPWFTWLFIIPVGCRDTEQPPESGQEYVTNPIVEHGADPWVIADGGKFHYCYSSGDAIYIKSVERFSDMNTAQAYKIWQAPLSGMYSRDIWAPELHRIRGKWYVYFAADNGENSNHRMYVISSKDENLHTTFDHIGKINDPTDKWAIDGTIFEHADRLYFIWSGWEGDVNGEQDLYIAEMESPVSIRSERMKIASPEYEWEKRGSDAGLPTINEGPEILEKEGHVFIIYSASGSWSDDYCLGLLEFTGGNPMAPSSWVKDKSPVFEGTKDIISPGHASFITSGQQDYIIYHTTGFRGGGWQNRQVNIQPFYWENNKPEFGEPVQPGKRIRIVY